MLNEGSALIPPQAISGEFIDISVTTASGTETVTYTLTSKAFLTGHEYTLNIEVNSAAIGNTNAITGWTSEGTVNVLIDKYDIPYIGPAGVEAVDLGLSVKWANMNVGATNEKEYGTFFGWGETVGFTVQGVTTNAASNNSKSTAHDWTNYWWGNSATELTKYNINSDLGLVDNKTTLELVNDAARLNWGGSWRMPTEAEINELIATYNTEDNTNWKWEWESDNETSRYGYLVTYKGVTPNTHIFIPAAGHRFGSELQYQKNCGQYWTSSLFLEDPTHALYLYIAPSSALMHHGNLRYMGCTIRPVQNY